MHDPFDLFLVVILGLCFGSFATAASYRLPLDQEIIRKPSFCPSCNKRLGIRDLVPVFSWLINRGKCRSCKKPVSMRYPLTECITALAFACIYWEYGIAPVTPILMLMSVALIIQIIADFEHQIIPDETHFALIPLAIAYHYILGTGWVEPLTGAAIGLLLGLSLQIGFRVLRKKEGLGMGDVKFLFVAGLWLGITPFVPFLFLSGISGVATALLWRALGKGEVFPFGPALALALYVMLVWPEMQVMYWSMMQSLFHPS